MTESTDYSWQKVQTVGGRDDKEYRLLVAEMIKSTDIWCQTKKANCF